MSRKCTTESANKNIELPLIAVLFLATEGLVMVLNSLVIKIHEGNLESNTE
jgi:hypothetical protein